MYNGYVNGVYAGKRWYYIGNSDGSLSTNIWVDSADGKSVYYIDFDGSMATGKKTINGVEYKFAEDGRLISGTKPVQN